MSPLEFLGAFFLGCFVTAALAWTVDQIVIIPGNYLESDDDDDEGDADPKHATA